MRAWAAPTHLCQHAAVQVPTQRIAAGRRRPRLGATSRRRRRPVGARAAPAGPRLEPRVPGPAPHGPQSRRPHSLLCGCCRARPTPSLPRMLCITTAGGQGAGRAAQEAGCLPHGRVGASPSSQAGARRATPALVGGPGALVLEPSQRGGAAQEEAVGDARGARQAAAGAVESPGQQDACAKRRRQQAARLSG